MMMMMLVHRFHQLRPTLTPAATTSLAAAETTFFEIRSAMISLWNRQERERDNERSFFLAIFLRDDGVFFHCRRPRETPSCFCCCCCVVSISSLRRFSFVSVFFFAPHHPFGRVRDLRLPRPKQSKQKSIALGFFFFYTERRDAASIRDDGPMVMRHH